VLRPPRARAAAFAPAATRTEAIELVAAGVGLLVVPQSLARLHHRRDLTYRPLANSPGSGVGLAWPDTENTELMEEFIGIVRGGAPSTAHAPPRDENPAPGRPALTKQNVAQRPPARPGTFIPAPILPRRSLMYLQNAPYSQH
jgi:LysR substrate binding domain